MCVTRNTIKIYVDALPPNGLVSGVDIILVTKCSMQLSKYVGDCDTIVEISISALSLDGRVLSPGGGGGNYLKMPRNLPSFPPK